MLPDGVEHVVRRTKTGALRIFINHTERAQTVRAAGRNVLSNTDVDGDVAVAPGDVLIVRIETSPEGSRK